MDPSEQPSLADLIMSRGNATVLERNGIRIVSAGPLRPIETDENNVPLFKCNNFNKPMVLSGINDGASARFWAPHLSNSTFEIRNMNISIFYPLFLHSCNLTFINCRISASDITRDEIKAWGGSLKFVGCIVNDCRISVSPPIAFKKRLK
jgi:hypothetical protein